MTLPGFRELEAEVIADHNPNNDSILISNLTMPANKKTDGANVVCILAPNPPLIVPRVTLTVQGETVTILVPSPRHLKSITLATRKCNKVVMCYIYMYVAHCCVVYSGFIPDSI